MKKRSKVTAVLLSLALLICALPTTVVKADSTGNSDDTSVEVSPYISLGADLNAQQKDIVLALLGVTEADLDNYEVLQVTNKDEHEYLDDYLSASVIGTKGTFVRPYRKMRRGKMHSCRDKKYHLLHERNVHQCIDHRRYHGCGCDRCRSV